MKIFIAFYQASKEKREKKDLEVTKSAERLMKKKKEDGNRIWGVTVKMNFPIDDSFDVRTDARNWRGDEKPDSGFVVRVNDEDIIPEEGLTTALKSFSKQILALPQEAHEVVIFGHGEDFCIAGLSGARLAKTLLKWGLKPSCLINIVSCKAAGRNEPKTIVEITQEEHVSWAKDFHAQLLRAGIRCTVKARCAKVIVNPEGQKKTRFVTRPAAGEKETVQEKSQRDQPRSRVFFTFAQEGNELVQYAAFKPDDHKDIKTRNVWFNSHGGLQQVLSFVKCAPPHIMKAK